MLNTLLNVYNRHTGKITFGAGLLIGLLVGWLAIGWWLWPVTYSNTTPQMLRQGDIRDEYMVLVARDYAITGNVEQARIRLGTQYWRNEDPAEALEALAQARPTDAPELVALAGALRAAQPETPPAPLTQRLRPAFTICGLGLIVIAVVGLLYLRLSRRRRAALPVVEEEAFPPAAEPVAWAEAANPIGRYKTTYTLGDDFYDPSFSIERENGDFMGECGVGISEAIGVGDPKKVTALELWVFDKNDIRTVTKVLMSRHAFHDDALRAKLAAKGESVLAQPGAEVTLQTATLLLRARVLELEYGQGQLPPESFFQRLTLDIAVWGKSSEEVGGSPAPLG